MPQRMFVLGGSGQIGRALVPSMLGRGWSVTVGTRGNAPVPEGAEAVSLDRNDTDSLRAALGDGVDVLVDCIAYEPAHAEELLALGQLARSLIVISSAAVYADADGRSFDSDEFPAYPVPIRERVQPTVEPGDASYGTKKRAIELTLLGQDDMPSTLIRAGAIYGTGREARELYFVKRVLDGRRYVVLGDRGRSRFHTIGAENLAELIRLSAERPGSRVLNAGDPDAPTLLEISRAVAAAMDHEWTEVLLPSGGEPCETPWTVPRPLVLDMAEAEFEVGYRPVTRYARAVRATCEWLVEASRDRPWQEVAPQLAGYAPNSFDYEAEDRLLSELGSIRVEPPRR
jgi:nucleoside-diphosphate-sugar epimerase